jgi:hypothetical protein
MKYEIEETDFEYFLTTSFIISGVAALRSVNGKCVCFVAPTSLLYNQLNSGSEMNYQTRLRM